MTIIYLLLSVLLGFCGEGAISAMALMPRVNGHKTALTSQNTYTAHASISSSLIKDAHCSDFSISPVAGVALVESRFLHNLHVFGDPQSPITQVVRELFHDHNFQTYDFRATIAPHKPAATLTFGRIAKIQHGLIVGNQENGNLVAEWRSAHSQEKKSTLSLSKFNKFLDLIVHAQKVAEMQGYPCTLSSILTALAMRKASGCQDVQEYLACHGINKTIGAYDRLHAIDFSKKFFGQGKIGLFTKDLLEPAVFESAAVALMLSQNSAYSIAPEVDGSIYCGFGGGFPCATCHEAALRDIVNNLVFDAENNRYDCALLGAAPMHPALKLFYAEFNNPAEHNTQKVAQAWMNIVSGLPNVSYERGRGEYSYEISGKASNSFAVLNYLLCSNKAKDWTDLGKRLSDDVREVSFTASQDMKREYVSLLINSKKTDGPSLELTLNVDSQHILIDAPQRHGDNGATSRPIPYGMVLYEALLNKAYNKSSLYDCLLGNSAISRSAEAFTLFPFMRYFIRSAENSNRTHFDFINKEFFKSAPFGTQQYYLLARPLKTQYQKVAALDDGCNLLSVESKDLAAQLARMVDHISDSFSGASRVIYGIVRVHGAAIIEHEGLANSVANALVVACEKAITSEEKKILSDLIDRYKQSPLWNHPSADRIKTKIQ